MLSLRAHVICQNQRSDVLPVCLIIRIRLRTLKYEVQSAILNSTVTVTLGNLFPGKVLTALAFLGL